MRCPSTLAVMGQVAKLFINSYSHHTENNISCSTQIRGPGDDTSPNPRAMGVSQKRIVRTACDHCRVRCRKISSMVKDSGTTMGSRE